MQEYTYNKCGKSFLTRDDFTCSNNKTIRSVFQYRLIKGFRQRMKVNKILKEYVKNNKKALENNNNNNQI
jgi:hypothetical protein